MKKILLISKREYLTRVMKKSFLIMTILGPVLIAAFYAIIIYLTINENLGNETRNIAVTDHQGILAQRMKSSDYLKFTFIDSTEGARPDVLDNYYALLDVPAGVSGNDMVVQLSSRENVSLQTKSAIESKIKDAYESSNMEKLGIPQHLLDSVKTSVAVKALKVEKNGKSQDSSTELYTILGMVLAGAIYFFIFLYGVQVMRGVIEEKTNRIVEVIVSSVKPFQLMMGKVLGIAAVGLTQIIIWVALSTILITVISAGVGAEHMPDAQTMQQMQQAGQQLPSGKMEVLLGAIKSLNLPLIALSFIFYFAGGYLLYSALFAAVGSAVDNETDTQQFMFPITLPLVFAFVLSTSVVMRDPNGTLSFWLSMFPLTSPIVMMVRLPFLSMPDQAWQLGLSMLLLVLFFIFTIWLAGRIYRTGILMYGKKATYRELFKWLFYK